MKNTEKTMEQIVNLCKNRGFVYAGSAIYGGLANTWDYGPLGVELKNNIKQAWWTKFVRRIEYNVGLDSAILMNPQVWVASGHVGGFSDPLMDCKSCKARFREDDLIENTAKISVAGWENKDMEQYIAEHDEIVCPQCGKRDFTPIRKFNLMFKTFQGVTEDAKSEIFMRPETAQGIFVNFKNIQRTTRKKIPFGVAQIGKSFRNEITPGNFIFRTREFEQMELEFFCKPGTDLEWFEFWKNYCKEFLLGLGIKEESIKLRDHEKSELSHYSNATTDIEFLFPFGFGELWGIADRTDFDLKAHESESGEPMDYFDPVTNEKYVPYVIEPSLGCERLLLAVLVDAYDEEVVDPQNNDTRIVLRLHPQLAPIKAAVLPLSKKLSESAKQKVFDVLQHDYMCEFDDAGSIGKRYRRQDEIGTPFCITYDFDSEQDGCVTVRERDSMQQKRISIGEIKEFLADKLKF